MKQLTLLIVDDEYWIRRKLVTRFDWAQFGINQVLEAENGEEAIRMIRETVIDIVLTDMDMPFVSGRELIAMIRKDKPETHIVVLSGYSDFPLVKSALLGGAVNYLLKPVQEDELYATMQMILAKYPEDSADTNDFTGLKEYVDAHFTEDLSLPVLADRFGFSTSYLSKLFKKEAGKNLITYVTEKRMEKAQRLLVRRNASVSDVAEACGYEDYAYFSNLFKKAYGISPKEYQRQNNPNGKSK